MKILTGKETLWQEYVKNNTDPYGGRCVSYAKGWAELMEAKMAEGQTVAECAQAAATKADYDGITGFMYGCAVSMLAQCWEHGEELRKWHNLDTQLGTEGEKANASGGVLNPALLNIG